MKNKLNNEELRNIYQEAKLVYCNNEEFDIDKYRAKETIDYMIDIYKERKQCSTFEAFKYMEEGR